LILPTWSKISNWANDYCRSVIFCVIKIFRNRVLVETEPISFQLLRKNSWDDYGSSDLGLSAFQKHFKFGFSRVSSKSTFWLFKNGLKFATNKFFVKCSGFISKNSWLWIDKIWFYYDAIFFKRKLFEANLFLKWKSFLL